MMIRARRLIAVTVLLMTSAASANPVWKRYTPEGAKYSIEMPGAWTSKTDTDSDGMKETTTVVTTAAAEYTVFYLVPASAGTFPKGSLDKFRDGVMSASKGKLSRNEKITSYGYPAQQFIIDAANTTTNANGIARIINFGDGLLAVLVMGPETIATEPDTMRFLTSLHIAAPK